VPRAGRVGYRWFDGFSGPRWIGKRRKRTLDEPELPNRWPAEIDVNTFAKRSALVLKEQGSGGFGLQGENAATRTFGEFDGPGDPCRCLASDLRPMQYQCRIGEAGPRKGGSRSNGRVPTDRLGARAPLGR